VGEVFLSLSPTSPFAREVRCADSICLATLSLPCFVDFAYQLPIPHEFVPIDSACPALAAPATRSVRAFLVTASFVDHCFALRFRRDLPSSCRSRKRRTLMRTAHLWLQYFCPLRLSRKYGVGQSELAQTLVFFAPRSCRNRTRMSVQRSLTLISISLARTDSCISELRSRSRSPILVSSPAQALRIKSCIPAIFGISTKNLHLTWSMCPAR
jgi:hypothetical protein